MDSRVWQTSRCGESGYCVEVSFAPDDIWVRNSRDPNGPVLKFNDGEWDAFVGGTKDGEFDL